MAIKFGSYPAAMFGQGVYNKTFQFFYAVLFAQPVFEVVPVLPISCRARPHIAQTERNKQIVVYYIYNLVHDIVGYINCNKTVRFRKQYS